MIKNIDPYMLPCISTFVTSMIPSDISASEPWGFDLFYDNITTEWKVRRAPGSEQYYQAIEENYRKSSNSSEADKNRLLLHLIQVSDENGENFQILGETPLIFKKYIDVGLHRIVLDSITSLGPNPSDQSKSSTSTSSGNETNVTGTSSGNETNVTSTSSGNETNVLSDDLKKLSFNSDK